LMSYPESEDIVIRKEKKKSAFATLGKALEHNR
jgi:hypothetical protein